MENGSYNIPEFFYDLIAILFPGFFILGYIYLLIPESTIYFLKIYPYCKNPFVFLFIAYVLGHISYSLSSIIIARLFHFLSGNPTKTLLGKSIRKHQKAFNRYMLGEVIEHDHYFSANVTRGIIDYTNNVDFNLHKAENMDIAYEFCRNFIIEKASKSYLTIRKEQAYGELSRSLILICLIFIPFLFYAKYANVIKIEYWGYKIFATFLILASFIFRYGQVRHTVPIFVYSTFCSFLIIKEKDNENRIIQI